MAETTPSESTKTFWAVVVVCLLACGCSAIVSGEDKPAGNDSSTATSSQETDSQKPIDTDSDPIQDTSPEDPPATTAVSITAGGSGPIMESSNYRARLFVGGPPMGEAHGTNHDAKLGIGAVVDHQK